MPEKEQTQKQWNAHPCGSSYADSNAPQESLQFFESVNRNRYQGADAWIKRHIPFDIGKGKKVLEIGFGMGSDLLEWRKQGAECFGVDLTEEHHRLASLNFSLHQEKAQLQIADAAALPYPDHFFDIVYSSGVLHHTPDTVRCISEAHRVLQKGGLFILSMYHTFSAFHLVQKILNDGIIHGQLKRLGYQGLMATLEKGADGIQFKPLVKTYRKSQLRNILEDFSSVEFKVAHLTPEHFGFLRKLIPKFLETKLEKWLGWYLIAFARK